MKCSPETLELPFNIALLAEYRGKPRAFARIDVNASDHENRDEVCGVHHLISAGKSHFHDTRLHEHIDINHLFSDCWDLPIATALPHVPDRFQLLMEMCAELLHIENLAEVEEPQWQPRQFPF